MKNTKCLALILSMFTLLGSASRAADVPQSFTLDGRLWADAAGTTPLQDGAIAFTVQILDEAKVCVIYEESQTISTAASKGYFTVQVGTDVGSPLRTAGDSANSMPTVFQNISVINGKLLSNGSPCTVSPVGGKRRYVRIKILPPTMGGIARTLSPDLTIDSVPNAIIAERAESLQGLRSTDVLRVNTAGTNQLSQTNLENLFTSSTRFSSLTSLVDGTSVDYMRSNSISGANLPVMAGAPTMPVPGAIWYDSSDSKLKYQTSVGPVIVGSGSGTVTSVGFTAPSELSVAGAPVTSSGTIAVTWATQTANKVFASPDATTGTPSFRALVAGDIPSLPWTKITSLLPTTLLGYGITDAVRNAGGTPSFESGLNAAKGAATTAGRIWISTDTKEIYRDNGTTWDLIGNAATGTGDFLANGTIPMTGTLKMGGNTIYGNSTASGNLTLESTSDATKGHVILQPTSGNVGIGTTNPGATLDVVSAGAHLQFDGSLLVNRQDGFNSGSSAAFIQNHDVTNGQGNGLLIWSGNGTSDYPLLVKSNGGVANLLAVRADGNVGIGNSAPSYPLDIHGVPNPNGANHALLNLMDSSASGVDVGGGVQFGGRYSSGGSQATFSGINGGKANSTSGDYAGYLSFNTRSNGGALSERMRIDPSGNVGIGTTSPSSRLTVEDTGSAGTYFEVKTQLAEDAKSILSNYSSSAWWNKSNLDFHRGRGTIASPSAVVSGDALGAIHFRGYSSGFNYNDSAAIITSEVDGAPAGANVPGRLIFGTLDSSGVSHTMVMKSTGNVGIGTTSPSTTLDLNGAQTFRGAAAATAPPTAGQGKIYFDSTANKFKVSENNGAYVDLVGSGGGGTVTSVGLSLPAEITVTNSPVTTSGTLTGTWANQTANKVFASPDSATGAPTFRALVANDIPALPYLGSTATAGGDLSGNYPNPTVNKIRSVTVSATAPNDGQVLKYVSGTTSWTPSNLSIGNLLTAAGAQQFAGSASCTAAQTLTWSSLTDTFTCANIAGLDGGVITTGTIAAARLPASASLWTESSGDIYRSTGKVGIGTTSPTQLFEVVTPNNGGVLFSDTGTNNTAKDSRIGQLHYTNTEEPFYSIVGYSDATNNHVYIGGGTSQGNAATEIFMNIAANNTTTIGTKKMLANVNGTMFSNDIGSALPSQIFHIFGAAGAGSENLLKIQNFDATATTARSFSFRHQDAGAFYVVRDTGGGDVTDLSISATGNVGVGTTSPGAQLQANTSAIGTIGQILKWGQAGQTANLLEFQNNTGTILSRVDKDGKFYGDGSGLTGVTPSFSGLSTTGFIYATSATATASTAAADMSWDNTNKRLGIGTATPANQLELYKASGFNTLLVANGGGSSGDGSSVKIDRGGTSAWGGVDFATGGTTQIGIGLKSTDTTNGFSIWDPTASDATRFFVDGSTGNVVVGAAAAYAPLVVQKDGAAYSGTFTAVGSFVDTAGAKGVFLGYDSSGTIGMIGADSAAGGTSDLSFVTRNSGTFSEKMRITGGGYVGIGGTGPTSELTVESARTTGEPFIHLKAGKGAGQGPVVSFTRTTNTQQNNLRWMTATGSVQDGYLGSFANKASAIYMYASTAGAGKTVAGVDDTTGFVVGEGGGSMPGTYRARITPAGNGYFLGNLGIGTDSPTTRFQLAGANSGSYWGTSGIGVRIEAATYTDTSSSGSPGPITAHNIGSPTLAASSATTYSQAATLRLQGPPTAGTNVSISDNYALYILNGNNYFGGGAYFGDDVSIGTATKSHRLTVADSQAAGAIAIFDNTSTGNDSDGIIIQTGPNSNPTSTNDFVQFTDGDGTVIGQIEGTGGASVAYTTTSDRRLKENIRDTKYSLQNLLNIQVKDYNYLKSDVNMTGFIAQDLYEVFPEAVSKPVDESKEFWGVDYSKLSPLIVKAVQDIYQYVTGVDKRVHELEVANAAKDQKIKELEARLEKIEKSLSAD